jgi:hypothetical protein
MGCRILGTRDLQMSVFQKPISAQCNQDPNHVC